MDFSFFSYVNYGAVLVSAVVFFMLGSVWFSTLFGRMWVAELQRHNVIIKAPTTAALCTKMVLTFAANLLAAWCIALLVNMTGSTTAASGLQLGVIVVLGCAITTLASVFVWESRSLKLFLIDIGYPAVGIIASAIILSVWR